ncbi:hypothetical protein B0J14DRAFT_641065 [Halenospora varia]|nr:hypothetical protein B0J14DRAFT_641065 [Halenospora varia]
MPPKRKDPATPMTEEILEKRRRTARKELSPECHSPDVSDRESDFQVQTAATVSKGRGHPRKPGRSKKIQSKTGGSTIASDGEEHDEQAFQATWSKIGDAVIARFEKYALNCRLDTWRGSPKPRKSDLNTSRNEKIVEKFKENAGSEAITAFEEVSLTSLDDLLKKTLDDKLGVDLPLHLESIEKLKLVAQEEKLDQRKLIKRDLVNIINAWDRYTAASKRSLLEMSAYANQWMKEHTATSANPTGSQKLRTTDISGVRKQWMMHVRHTRIQEERTQNPRTPEDELPIDGMSPELGDPFWSHHAGSPAINGSQSPRTSEISSPEPIPRGPFKPF